MKKLIYQQGKVPWSELHRYDTGEAYFHTEEGHEFHKWPRDAVEYCARRNHLDNVCDCDLSVAVRLPTAALKDPASVDELYAVIGGLVVQGST